MRINANALSSLGLFSVLGTLERRWAMSNNLHFPERSNERKYSAWHSDYLRGYVRENRHCQVTPIAVRDIMMVNIQYGTSKVTYDASPLRNIKRKTIHTLDFKIFVKFWQECTD